MTFRLTAALAALLVSAPLAAEPVELPLFDAEALSDGELGRVAGREDVVQIDQTASVQNTSTVVGNSVNGSSVTGTINFDGAAFQNLNGLSVLSANTGNNVSINAAMNVNVALQP
jgi:hypothetical protein